MEGVSILSVAQHSLPPSLPLCVLNAAPLVCRPTEKRHIPLLAKENARSGATVRADDLTTDWQTHATEKEGLGTRLTFVGSVSSPGTVRTQWRPSAVLTVSEAFVDDLVGMGHSRELATLALQQTFSLSVEGALQLLARWNPTTASAPHDDVTAGL